MIHVCNPKASRRSAGPTDQKALCFHVSRRAVGIASLVLAVTQPENSMYQTRVVTINRQWPIAASQATRAQEKINWLVVAFDVLPQGMRLLECKFTNQALPALYFRRLYLPQLFFVPLVSLGFNKLTRETTPSSTRTMKWPSHFTMARVAKLPKLDGQLLHLASRSRLSGYPLTRR